MIPNHGRFEAKTLSVHRGERKISFPLDRQGKPCRMSEYYGRNTFDFRTARGISESVKKELIDIAHTNRPLTKELAGVVAKAALEWSLSQGATHYCHWFQPLTGSTAEKHDSFLHMKGGHPIEELSADQLMQGEPDASSFPNGGSRSTFEARGYTSWDLSSPMFLVKSTNGKTLYIPTAFISYTGEALDVKTPLLRSEMALSLGAKRFLKSIGQESAYVNSNCGCEQEYFLIDRAFYFARPDLVMTGRTLFGSLSTKNQQLDDHYFGNIPERVVSFMQELDYELHKLGVPAKTRHNEVAPGQYEIAPIFDKTNLAADFNQITMLTLERVAHKHHFQVLLHEKPFAGINGSGKHLNWSLSTAEGDNLLNPGHEPEVNHRFLTICSAIIEALYRHGGMIRASIASAGNDHRLGANEAPPSIISVYLGDTLEKIFNAIREGRKFSSAQESSIELMTTQLANLNKDNSDRNRTSPFAFTGNKFELRACGSEAAIGLPLTILNGAVSEVLNETAEFIERATSSGSSPQEAMEKVTKKWIENAHSVIFNGDGYSQDWIEEAKKRGLPNLRTTPEALPLFNDEKKTSFLVHQKIFTYGELKTRFHVLMERYNSIREIELRTLLKMIHQHVLPAVIHYKRELGDVIKTQKELKIDSIVEKTIYKKINYISDTLYARTENLARTLDDLGEGESASKTFVKELLPLSEEMAHFCHELEELIPDELWTLPKYYDMLFLK